MIWEEWNYFILFICVCVVSVCFLWKYSHFSLKTELREAFLPKPQKTLSSMKGWLSFFFCPWRTEAFLLWFCLCSQERTKHLPAKFTLKVGKVEGLEYLRRLERGLESFGSNLPLGCTYIIWHNESMNDTNIETRKTREKKGFETIASFWLWILQIVETAAKGRSKFPLIQDKIWALWNVTWFEARMWILLETPPSYPAVPSKSIRGTRTSNRNKSSRAGVSIFHCCLAKGRTRRMRSSIHKQVACSTAIFLVCSSSSLCCSHQDSQTAVGEPFSNPRKMVRLGTSSVFIYGEGQEMKGATKSWPKPASLE